jgi:hypothetical protein
MHGRIDIRDRTAQFLVRKAEKINSGKNNYKNSAAWSMF